MSSEAPARQKKKKKRSVGRIIAKTFGWIFLTLFTICVIGVLTIGIFAKIFMTYVDTTLIPSLGEVTSEEMQLALASTIYDKNGTPILTLYDNSDDTGGNRELVKYSEIPKHLVNALVSIEDHRFWEHHGVDWVGTAASIRDTLFGGNTRGGSTITQQLLRKMYDDTDVTVRRKFREICRALEYEKSVGKEDIITDYLNTVYFGAGAYGIQTAAKTYFGKDVSELSVAESAAIVGITNNPSLYDPFLKKEFKQDDGTVKTPRDFNKSRQELILKQMVEYGYLTEAEAAAAKAEKLLFTDTDEYKALHGIEVPEETEEDEKKVDLSKIYTWFEDEAINEAITLLCDQYGYAREYASKLLYRGGFHIYTTLDPEVQAVVDEVYQDTSNFDYPSKKGTPINSAITVIDPYTGEVKAMAGGVGVKTVNRGENLATRPRMPGSAIKPVAVYAPAIEYDVVSPASVIDNYPINNTLRAEGYPRNSNGRYTGYMTIARGLQGSVNTISARTLEKLGYARSFEFMQNNLGFHLDANDIALAPLSMGGLTYGVTTMEMAAAYSAFVNKGIYTKPHLITRIESNDHTETVIDNTTPQSWPAMKETTAYLMNKMLRSVVTSGTGGDAAFSGMTIAGKTGTTTDNCDRYFAGYTPYYAAAVWMGYKDKPEKIYVKHGENPSAVVWRKVMEKLHEGLEDKGFFERPEGITSVNVCADCGLKATDLCTQDYRGSRTVTMEVQASAVPKENCSCHIEVQVCTNPETEEVYLANEYCPEDTVTTRVMLVGRQFLGEPGSYILAEDSEAHKTYLESKGPCPIHDEFYVPEPSLPGEGEPLPGDPDYQWPVGPFDPDSVLPGWEDPTPWTPPDTQEPDPGEPPVEKPDPAADPNDRTGDPVPQEPEEPALPDEPTLPDGL